MVSSSFFAQRRMYGGDADPYFNEPTWNERMPSAVGVAPVGVAPVGAAPSVMFVYNIGQQAPVVMGSAPPFLGAPTARVPLVAMSQGTLSNISGTVSEDTGNYVGDSGVQIPSATPAGPIAYG